MPRKAIKKDEVKKPAAVTPSAPEPQPEVEPEAVESPNVEIVEINGRKYNKIFNPVDGTTSLEPLI